MKSSARRGRIGVLALDFDGTLKNKNRPVKREVKIKLRQLRSSGIKLILVTGRCERELRELIETSLFDAVVAENGAILFHGERKIILAPNGWFKVRMGLLKFFDDGCEEVIIAAERNLQEQATRVVNLSLARIELNKDRMMIMPRGIDKTSGLLAALRRLRSSRAEMMCIGDGENDLSMFKIARVSIALENSVESLKREADYVAKRADGEGVLEAIDRFIYGRIQRRTVDNSTMNGNWPRAPSMKASR